MVIGFEHPYAGIAQAFDRAVRHSAAVKSAPNGPVTLTLRLKDDAERSAIEMMLAEHPFRRTFPDADDELSKFYYARAPLRDVPALIDEMTVGKYRDIVEYVELPPPHKVK